MVMPSVHNGNKNTRVYSFNLQGLKDQNFVVAFGMKGGEGGKYQEENDVGNGKEVMCG